ncbi:MAG: hypothetical protein WD512_01475, partial [Candidatus Paceibacterota bacterium]
MKTLYKYIQVQEGFVLTSDEEIKVGDWYIVKLYKITEYEDNGGTFTLEQCKKTEDVWINNFDVVQTRYKDNCKKIIFCSPNLSLDGISVIEIEEDVEKLAIEYAKKITSANGRPEDRYSLKLAF